MDKEQPKPKTNGKGEEQATARTAGTVIFACVAGAFALYFGREFFVPIAFAFLLNAMCRPLVRGMEKVKIPTPLAAGIVVLSITAGLFLAVFFLAQPMQGWIAAAPEKVDAAQGKLDRLRKPIAAASNVAGKVQQAAEGPTSQPSAPPAPAPASPVAGSFIGTTTKILGGITEVLVLLLLLLASGDLFMDKLVKVIPATRDKKTAVNVVRDVQSAVNRYMLVTLAINVAQAVLVMIAMRLLNMPSPWLWGLFTVVLEFIPYLGATVMIALLAIMSFATFDSMGHILAVPISYLVITTVQNNIVSPIAYGQKLKLNPAAVLIGVLLWWFLWGIPGAFLAVPIIATVKIICDRTQKVEALGEFLGD